jgi:hypothetical protein
VEAEAGDWETVEAEANTKIPVGITYSLSGDSLPSSENGCRGNLPNTAPYSFRAGATAVHYGYFMGQV